MFKKDFRDKNYLREGVLMIVLKEEVTTRLQSMAFLLDNISSLYSAGLITDIVALEKVNCYFNHIDEVMKIAESEINEEII